MTEESQHPAVATTASVVEESRLRGILYLVHLEIETSGAQIVVVVYVLYTRTSVRGWKNAHLPRSPPPPTAWSMKTRRALSRHCWHRHARVYGHTTTGTHEMGIAPIEYAPHGRCHGAATPCFSAPD